MRQADILFFHVSYDILVHLDSRDTEILMFILQ